MDKGYHLLKALGYEELARQVRSKNERTTGISALEFVQEIDGREYVQAVCKEIIQDLESEKRYSLID
jgi:hypothetical protein